MIPQCLAEEVVAYLTNLTSLSKLRRRKAQLIETSETYENDPAQLSAIYYKNHLGKKILDEYYFEGISLLFRSSFRKLITNNKDFFAPKSSWLLGVCLRNGKLKNVKCLEEQFPNCTTSDFQLDYMLSGRVISNDIKTIKWIFSNMEVSRENIKDAMNQIFSCRIYYKCALSFVKLVHKYHKLYNFTLMYESSFYYHGCLMRGIIISESTPIFDWVLKNIRFKKENIISITTMVLIRDYLPGLKIIRKYYGFPGKRKCRVKHFETAIINDNLNSFIYLWEQIVLNKSDRYKVINMVRQNIGDITSWASKHLDIWIPKPAFYM